MGADDRRLLPATLPRHRHRLLVWVLATQISMHPVVDRFCSVNYTWPQETLVLIPSTHYTSFLRAKPSLVVCVCSGSTCQCPGHCKSAHGESINRRPSALAPPLDAWHRQHWYVRPRPSWCCSYHQCCSALLFSIDFTRQHNSNKYCCSLS